MIKACFWNVICIPEWLPEIGNACGALKIFYSVGKRLPPKFTWGIKMGQKHRLL